MSSGTCPSLCAATAGAMPSKAKVLVAVVITLSVGLNIAAIAMYARGASGD